MVQGFSQTIHTKNVKYWVKSVISTGIEIQVLINSPKTQVLNGKCVYFIRLITFFE